MSVVDNIIGIADQSFMGLEVIRDVLDMHHQITNAKFNLKSGLRRTPFWVGSRAMLGRISDTTTLLEAAPFVKDSDYDVVAELSQFDVEGLVDVVGLVCGERNLVQPREPSSR